MIEAVNSVISNAQVLKNSAEQVNAARVETPEPVRTFPLAPYVSPFIAVDVNFNTAVLQIRNSDTGDVIRQFPSESTLEARRRAETAENSIISLQEETSGGDGEITGVNTVQTVEVGVSAQASEALPVAQAQIAAQALSAGAQAGQSVSGNISVVA